MLSAGAECVCGPVCCWWSVECDHQCSWQGVKYQYVLQQGDNMRFRQVQIASFRQGFEGDPAVTFADKAACIREQTGNSETNTGKLIAAVVSDLGIDVSGKPIVRQLDIILEVRTLPAPCNVNLLPVVQNLGVNPSNCAGMAKKSAPQPPPNEVSMHQ